MNNKTILETIEHEIKTDPNLSHIFKNSYIQEHEDYVSYYPLKYEFDFGYAIFKLYCFCNYSIDDIYELLIKLSKKYNKSDLKGLSYSDFVEYTKNKQFEYRKKQFLKTSDSFKKKLESKEKIVSDNIDNLITEYNDITIIIERLNKKMKFFLNDDDISSTELLKSVNSYSKTIQRLNEIKFEIYEKIGDEKL